MIGHIYKRGANIIEEKRRLIHVSGHASQDDIRIMTEAVRPKFVVPIHGEYRMLFRHKEFVKNHLGYAEENIVLIENGDVLELDGERAVITGKKEIRRTFIDDSGFEEIEYDTVRERKKMAYEGMITLVVVINRETGELQSPPQIVAQGVRGFESSNGMTEGCAAHRDRSARRRVQTDFSGRVVAERARAAGVEAVHSERNRREAGNYPRHSAGLSLKFQVLSSRLRQEPDVYRPGCKSKVFSA